MDNETLGLLPLLLARLERISADSHLAHRASGIRGALLKILEQLEAGQKVDSDYKSRLLKRGFEILDRSALEKLRKGLHQYKNTGD
jgi:hypothetical protein